MSDKKRERSPREEPWRNVRIKEEPVSDVEGSKHSRDRDRDPHHHRDRQDRPESSSSRSRDRDRPSSSSNSNSRSRAHEFFDDGRPDRRGGGGDRDRSDARPDRPIKRERRSGSRSPSREEFARPPPPRQRQDDRRPKEEPRERPKREQDWEQFFNPESSMSQQAVARRDASNQERDEGDEDEDGKKKVEKEKPNFGLSGKLTEETNSFKGVVIKYSEPPEARKPIKTRWRLYPFKGGEALEVMYIHRQSAYLLGRERKIADIPIDHPSCSKQHAVIQYRLVPYTKPNGSKGRRIRPYVIDLESANGTVVNGKKIEAKRYVELFEKDVLKFGFSSREYVLLHEHSKDDSPLDDDGYDRSPTPD